nr:uncharacterized protein LOC118680686 [Bactrocera oleae]
MNDHFRCVVVEPLAGAKNWSAEYRLSDMSAYDYHVFVASCHTTSSSYCVTICIRVEENPKSSELAAHGNDDNGDDDDVVGNDERHKAKAKATIGSSHSLLRVSDHGGGLAFILHNTVHYRLIDVYINRRDTIFECQGIAATLTRTFCTMNDEAATRIMGSCNSSPDIIIASGGLINSITWRPMLTLASDHLSIITSIAKPPDFISVNNRTFVNFNKSNWVGFTEFIESTFNALLIPTDVIVGERHFHKGIAAATARFILAGSIAELRPNLPAEAAVLANERATLHHADPCGPRIIDLNFEIRQIVNQHKRTKWIDHLKFCNFSTG